MDQLLCASLSHTHYWYEVGMLKVPANGLIIPSPDRVDAQKNDSMLRKNSVAFLLSTLRNIYVLLGFESRFFIAARPSGVFVERPRSLEQQSASICGELPAWEQK